MENEEITLLATKCREASIGNYDWADLLSDVTSWVGGDKALWLTSDAIGPYVSGLQFGHDPDVLQLYNGGYNLLDPRRHQSRDTAIGEVVPGQRYLSNNAVKHTDYFETINIGGNIKDSVFGVLCDDPIIGRHAISIQRGFRDEYFNDDDAARLAAIIPHLTEALRYSVALTRITARNKLGADVGFAFVDADYNLMHLGNSPHTLLMQSKSFDVKNKRLICCNEKTALAVQFALSSAFSGKYFCFRVPTDGGAQLVLEFSAIPDAANWIAQQKPQVMMVASIQNADYSSETAFFAATHDLSKKEAVVLRSILKTESARAASVDAGIEYETLRWYLKTIYSKTGYRRREDLLEAVRQANLSGV